MKGTNVAALKDAMDHTQGRVKTLSKILVEQKKIYQTAERKYKSDMKKAQDTYNRLTRRRRTWDRRRRYDYRRRRGTTDRRRRSPTHGGGTHKGPTMNKKSQKMVNSALKNANAAAVAAEIFVIRVAIPVCMLQQARDPSQYV